MNIRWTNQNPPVPNSVPDQMAHKAVEPFDQVCGTCQGGMQVQEYFQGTRVTRKCKPAWARLDNDMALFHAEVTIKVSARCVNCGELAHYEDVARA